MADSPPQITDLINKFEQNIDSYRNQAYGEAEVRVEFINPFFEALGWDGKDGKRGREPLRDGDELVYAGRGERSCC